MDIAKLSHGDLIRQLCQMYAKDVLGETTIALQNELNRRLDTSSDIAFLRELRENVEKGKRDVTRYEMALNMIDHWIEELEES